ncbi:type II toxin-antitoxin system Phd/YefM family antitoxin [Gulosibacter hominis]|uniref:type II toxin-antitoxin system Phd/YefM family antitoxin n=1 Tax=Gulosibacter hominis TaxID=2770504 RepID=UPI001918308C|nr:type II toxin-antitoxin system Phd/YefM family antitoxin [Gulosibacter hominis]
MTAVSATSARANLYRLIDQVNSESEPLTITGQRGNAVLVGEDDWRAIQESLFLASIPGMTESIRAARAEGISAGSEELDW